MSTKLDPLDRTLDRATLAWPGAGRVAAARARRATLVSASLPQIPGWVSESTLSVGEEAHLLRVHRADDAKRTPHVAKLLRPMGPDGEPRDTDEQRQRLLREVIALRALEDVGCHGIPRVVTFGVGTPAMPQPWYVMPFYAGGSMSTDAGGRWAEPYRGNVDRVLEIAETLATTLAALHEGPRPCVHGQVISGNVLFDRPGGQPILADFGYARLAGYTSGPVAWDVDAEWRARPPEADGRRGEALAADALSPASDVFMLGVLIYEALSGGRLLPPASCWPAGTIHERAEYSLRHDVEDPRLGAVSALLNRMLVRDAGRRLSARQVSQACRSIRLGTTIGGRRLAARR